MFAKYKYRYYGLMHVCTIVSLDFFWLTAYRVFKVAAREFKILFIRNISISLKNNFKRWWFARTHWMRLCSPPTISNGENAFRKGMSITHWIRDDVAAIAVVVAFHKNLSYKLMHIVKCDQRLKTIFFSTFFFLSLQLRSRNDTVHLFFPTCHAVFLCH